MIINIRGTSGSGKSTLARAVMQSYRLKTPFKVAGRKRPLGYIMSEPIGAAEHTLVVVGHYETDCGGCDTISKTEQTFRVIRDAAPVGNQHVLYEGLLLAADVKNALTLKEDGYDLVVVGLDCVPLEECLASVNERRRRRLGEKFTPVNPKNTESKFRGVANSMVRLEEAGVPVYHCDRAEALKRVRGLLGLSE